LVKILLIIFFFFFFFVVILKKFHGSVTDIKETKIKTTVQLLVGFQKSVERERDIEETWIFKGLFWMIF